MPNYGAEGCHHTNGVRNSEVDDYSPPFFLLCSTTLSFSHRHPPIFIISTSFFHGHSHYLSPLVNLHLFLLINLTLYFSLFSLGYSPCPPLSIISPLLPPQSSLPLFIDQPSILLPISFPFFHGSLSCIFSLYFS